MIHVANGWDQSFVNYFYTGILREGALSLDDIDIMGFSFYPFFNNKATLEALNATMHDITPKYKKVSQTFNDTIFQKAHNKIL